MTDLMTIDEPLFFSSSKEDCEKLADLMQEIRAKFNACEKDSREYVTAFMQFKELVRFFLSKEGYKVSAKLLINKTAVGAIYTLTVYNGQGDEISSRIFSSY